MIHAFDDDNKSKINLLDWIYPIGSIYMTTDNTPPEDLFGGQWKKIEQKFLFGADNNTDAYYLGNEGGQEFVTLDADSLPKHTHALSASGMNAIVYNGTFSTRQGIVSTDTSSNFKYLRVDNNATWAKASATQSTGLGNPHTNMPPYLAVNIWERIA